MLHVRFSLAVCLLASLASVPAVAGGDATADTPTVPCGNGVPGGIHCVASKKDVKEARTAYARGLKFEERQRFGEAFIQFDQAVRLVPQEPQFFSAREVARAQVVFQHTARGDAFLANAQHIEAAAEFHSALELDPENAYTQQRLAEAMRDTVDASPGGLPALLTDSGELHLEPTAARATFHYRGDVRGLFTELASAYSVSVQFDDSLQSRQVRFYVDDVDFFTALSLACRVSKAMWTPLDGHQFLVAADNSENHKQYDRMSLGTFAIPGATTPLEATELVTSLRNICDFQKINSGQNGTLEVRAPQAMLAACTKLLQGLTSERPQVALDINVYQVSHTLTRNIGVHIPDTFNLYNIPVGALAALGGQNIQSLINQLISSGGINQAGSSAISGLLAQLQGQQNSIFSQPLATFGGGLTFSGLSLDHFAAALSLNESWVRSLDHVTLRVGQGKEAAFHLGERYPILNASYAPIYNSPQISKVLGNQTYVPPFPSVSYEDLGLNLKATPVVHGSGEVSMKLDLQLRSLAGGSSNGAPIISNREYQGSIRLRDGEPAIVAGEVSSNDQRSMSGIPGLGFIPGLNQAMVNNSLTKEDDELLIVITPHVIANQGRITDEIWVTEK